MSSAQPNPPSVSSMLMENARYMPTADSVDSKDSPPSACQLECQSQQASLVECVDAIRDARQDTTSPQGAEKLTQTMECLAPSVQSWTDCCSKANLKEDESSAT